MQANDFMDLPEWAKDAVHLDSEIHFDLRDRLKMLIGWRPLVKFAIATEIAPGRTDPYASRVLMLRPSWWPFKPKFVGYMAVESEALSSREGE